MPKMSHLDFDTRNTLEFSLVDIPSLSTSEYEKLETLLKKKVELRNWQSSVRALFVDAAFRSALPERANLITNYEKVGYHARTLANLLMWNDEPVEPATLMRGHLVQRLNLALVDDPETDLPVHWIVPLLHRIADAASAWAKELKALKQGHAGPPARTAFNRFLFEIIRSAREAGDDLTLPGRDNTNPLFDFICHAIKLAVSRAEAALEKSPLADEERRLAGNHLRDLLPKDETRALLDNARKCVAQIKELERQ